MIFDTTHPSQDPVWPRASADWLHLAAAPTSAITGHRDRRLPGTLRAAAHDASPLTGMVVMHGPMGAFHLPPWLRLLGNRQRATRHDV
jgi:hypothetical protein